MDAENSPGGAALPPKDNFFASLAGIISAAGI
jgi:hypothetical protein